MELNNVCRKRGTKSKIKDVLSAGYVHGYQVHVLCT